MGVIEITEQNGEGLSSQLPMADFACGLWHGKRNGKLVNNYTNLIMKLGAQCFRPWPFLWHLWPRNP